MQNLSLEVSTQSSHAFEELVDVELAKLVHHDSVEFPLLGTTRTGAPEFLYDPPDDDALEAAKIVIHIEFAALVDFPPPMLIHFVRVSFKVLNLRIVDNRERFARLRYHCANMEKATRLGLGSRLLAYQRSAQ